MRKHLLLLLAALLPMLANAYDAEIDGIYYNFYGDEATVTSGSPKYSGAVVIPASVTYNSKTYSVTSIGQSAFESCSGLTSVTIPNSVTSIGDYAFRGCSGLTSVTIPNSVTSIGGYAFYRTGWYNAQPDGILYLDNWLLGYKGTQPAGNLTINNGTKGIAGSAFSDCRGLTSVTIPESVTSIDYSAFQDCKSLTSVTIPNSVTSIGYATFSGCSRLTSITIPNSVTSIGGYAFSGCSSLTSVTIPNSVTSIGNYAFSRCSSLTSITIPESVTSIGDMAFSNCTSLTSVTIPNSVTSIGGGAFFYCGSLTSITIPNSVTSIGNDAFYGCSGLTSVTIPGSVTSIGNYAFSSCSGLTSITIPGSVTYIGYDAFYNCTSLTEVYCLAESVPWTNSEAFYSSPIASATLHVPAASVEAYSTTKPWSDFGTIEAINATYYTITYYVDGKVYKTYEVEYGAAITPEPEPTKEGYTFSGWSEIPETMPAHNVIVNGSFTKIIVTCAKPTISYANGKLTFNCDTEGATCKYTITDTDIKSGSGNEVELVVTYTISVYATKDDYEDSEVATGTLCWIDQQPSTEGIIAEDAITEVKALPVLIQSNGGTITIQGANEGTEIMVYSVNGMKQGSAIATNGFATINTSLRPGSTAIVKIGEKAVKVLIK